MADPIPVALNINATTGASPTPPSTLRSTLVTNVAAVVPDYTANLPGTLIEDVTSTEMGAVITIDQAATDSINNISPVTANPYVLAMLGQQTGIAQGLPSNTSVYVVFSGPVGYIVIAGTIVSDGTYQYVLQSGTVIGASGVSASAYCVASQSGSWPVPVNTVNQIVTSQPSGYTITVNNPTAGVAGGAAESVQSYRARLLMAVQATAQGFVSLVKTMLLAIPGVQPRLVSVRQITTTWEILCGGGDPNAVAFAIYQSTLAFPALVGSSDSSLNVTFSLIDYPDTYNITFVSPAEQTVSITVNWNTTLNGFTAAAQVNQLGQTAVLNYINSIPVGNPLNLLQLYAVFQEAVAGVLSADYLTALTASVLVNGVAVSPAAGTSIIASDPEGYFSTTLTDVTVQQG